MEVNSLQWDTSREFKKKYLENLDEVTSFIARELAAGMNLEESFEMQVRAVKAVTEMGDFLRAFNEQIDRIDDTLAEINKKLEKLGK